LDVYKAFEPGINVLDCITNRFDCPLSGNCMTRNFREGLNDLIINYFESCTLADLIRKHKEKAL